MRAFHLALNLTASLFATTGAAIRPDTVHKRGQDGIEVSFKKTSICETSKGVSAYAGYVHLPATLDPEHAPYKQNIFFWFFQSRVHPLVPDLSPNPPTPENNTDSLAIILGGGPGVSSIDLALSGGTGPCNVVGPDTDETEPNVWSWNDRANLLYVDQPVGTGFSYVGEDVKDGVVDMSTGLITTFPDGAGDGDGGGIESESPRFKKGRFSEQEPDKIPATSPVAARAMYHFLQAWLGEFEEFRGRNTSLWSESYGGHYLTSLATYILERNEAIEAEAATKENEKRSTSAHSPAQNLGKLEPRTESWARRRREQNQKRRQKHRRYSPSSSPIDKNKREAQPSSNCTDNGPFAIPITTIGLFNPWIDALVQGHSLVSFPVNNTYDVEAISGPEDYGAMSDGWELPGGCRDKLVRCRALAKEKDPKGLGVDVDTNRACSAAQEFCVGNIQGVYHEKSGLMYDHTDLPSPSPLFLLQRNLHDVTHQTQDPHPPHYAWAYLNRPSVQADLGVAHNFTPISALVLSAFASKGDASKGHFLPQLSSILDHNDDDDDDGGGGGNTTASGNNKIRVILAYGDRDYVSNWVGGESVSLSLGHSRSANFKKAGYQNLQTQEQNQDDDFSDEDYTGAVGGLVREEGNLAFARVFQAGHEASWYRPEASYRIFDRGVRGMDVATGWEFIGPGAAAAAGEGYATKGPGRADGFREVPDEMPESRCLAEQWPWRLTCAPNQVAALAAGNATVEGGVVTEPLPVPGGEGMA
ncbi:Carboxypeptidase S1 A [Zalerion maritima]|uniref:Carboxypeptidase n=1 Tax=Zalerion maritima TaxID=339359 RepID=A0AAD5RQZ0_9PEZI|nr:Carboxypeptidase S1 A [Zalerion maritima]